MRGRATRILAGGRFLDAFDRAETWRIAGFHLFFTFLVGRVFVARSPGVGGGPGGLTPTGLDVVGFLGRLGASPDALQRLAELQAEQPGAALALLAAGLLAAPISGWLLGHGLLARDLAGRRLRVPALHAGRDAVGLAHLLASSLALAAVLAGSGLVVLLDAALRSPASALAGTLGPGLLNTALLALYGALFVALGALSAVGVRGGRRALLLGVLGLGLLLALAALPGLSLLSPFSRLPGLLGLGSRVAAAAAVLVLLGGASAATLLGLRRVDL